MSLEKDITIIKQLVEAQPVFKAASSENLAKREEQLLNSDRLQREALSNALDKKDPDIIWLVHYIGHHYNGWEKDEVNKLSLPANVYEDGVVAYTCDGNAYIVTGYGEEYDAAFLRGEHELPHLSNVTVIKKLNRKR
jgi:hypothetical protein